MATVENLSSRERAILLALAAQGGPVSNPELEERTGLRLDGAERTKLNDMKLVASERPGRAYVHQLTAEGWRLCGAVATRGPGARATAGEKALYATLAALGDYLDRTGQSLRNVFGRSEVANRLDPADEDRILAAYHTLASAPGEFVRLADVRVRLKSVPRTTTDAALAVLYRSHRANLVPESNQRTLTPADRQAALRIGGEDKHLIAIGAS